MKKNSPEMMEVVRQVFLFPFYYIRYVYSIIRNDLTISIKTTPSKEEFVYHLTHTFIGLLTINFFIFVFTELEIFKINYNAIINEIQFIKFYLHNFILLMIFSIVLLSALIFKRIEFSYFKSILIFNIKIFNIFFPIIFLTLLYISQFIIVDNIQIDLVNYQNNNNIPIMLKIAFMSFALIFFTMYGIIVKHTNRLLKSYYQLKFTNIFFKNKFPIMAIFLIVLAIFINFYSFSVLPSIKLEALIHKYEFCTEKINYSIYQTKQFDGCEMPFIEYQKMIKVCQKEVFK